MCRATTRERGLHNLVTLLAASFAYEEALVRSVDISRTPQHLTPVSKVVADFSGRKH